jgi:putative ABC transport system ATP-binding protein
MEALPPTLAGGEKQRLAIARAVVNRPEILLADEPTGNVDMRTGTEILTLFADAQRELGQTIVMVTHDPRSAAFGDEVLLLRDGNVEKQLDLNGKPTRSRTKPKVDHDARQRTVLKWLEA